MRVEKGTGGSMGRDRACYCARGEPTLWSVPRWRSQIAQDLVELLTLKLKDRLSEKEFCEDTPHRPNVNSSRPDVPVEDGHGNIVD